MTKRLGILTGTLVLAMALSACASKKPKTDESGMGDSAVATKNIGDEWAAGSDSGQIPGLNTIHFDYDQSVLSSEARRLLGDNAEWIKSNTGVTVQIEGHCDNRGSVEYNLALGERRAKSVKNYLVSLGVDGKRLTVISYGEEKPLVQGDTEEAYAKNRRANFVPLK